MNIINIYCVSIQSLYEDGLRSLAELSTASIELLRKIAELSLIHSVSALLCL